MSISNTINFIINHPLNKRHRLKSIIRFIKWQIISRFSSREIVYKWINNSKFLVNCGETGLTGNIYTGLHEFSDMGYLLHVLREDDTFIDVGANVGSYTILASSVVGAFSYTYEPIPSTFKRLIQNIKINNLTSKTKCSNIGIGNEPKTVRFTTDLNTTNHVATSSDNQVNTIDVEINTLDNLHYNTSPSLIKIDVEGFESSVIEGATKILKKKQLHSIIIELNSSSNRYSFDENKIINFLLELGFTPHSYNPINRSLLKLEGKNISSGNTIFIRDIDFVKNRITTSQKYEINGQYI